MTRILLVEDEGAIAQTVEFALRAEGFDTVHALTGHEALRLAASTSFELAILDVGLPDIGGFALCRELRSLSAALPIIFLTARDSDFDLVSGLRMGADDYLTKSAGLPEILARISALFRRADLLREPPAAEEVLERGPLAIDVKRFSVQWRGAAVPLTLTEFWMVHALAKFPEHVKSREQLMREANLVVDDGTITSHIKRIRRKFLAVDPAFDAIDTVYGMGYRWQA